jgi:hypothetical protein
MESSDFVIGKVVLAEMAKLCINFRLGKTNSDYQQFVFFLKTICLTI